MSSLPLAPLPWPDPVCADLYGLCINKSRWLSRNCSFTWNLHRIPGLHRLFSWGLGWESGQGMQPPLHLSFPSLPTPFSCPSPLPSPRLPNPAAMAATGQNKHGGQDRGAATQGADPGLAKAKAGGGQGQPSHGWKEEGLSGATEAAGTKAFASKGHSWTSPLGGSEGGLGPPAG